MGQFAEQLNEGKYDCLLKYKTHKVEAAVVRDSDGFVHILFYDKEFINKNLNRIIQLFVDATFDARAKLKDCMQFLNILGIYLGRVSTIMYNHSSMIHDIIFFKYQCNKQLLCL